MKVREWASLHGDIAYNHSHYSTNWTTDISLQYELDNEQSRQRTKSPASRLTTHTNWLQSKLTPTTKSPTFKVTPIQAHTRDKSLQPISPQHRSPAIQTLHIDNWLIYIIANELSRKYYSYLTNLLPKKPTFQKYLSDLKSFLGIYLKLTDTMWHIKTT